MKKTIFSLVIVILLAACQPAPTPCPTAAPLATVPPAPADTETLADSINMINGTWYAQNGVYFDFKSSGGAYYIYDATATPWINRVTGTWGFENGKLSFLTTQGDCAEAQQATYEIYLVKHEGRLIGMRPKLVGEDGCLGRKTVFGSNLFEYIGNLFFIGR